MAIIKLPIYVKLEKATSAGKTSLKIGQSAGYVPTRDVDTLAVLKFDLELEESLFFPAMNMNTTITVQAPQVLSKQTIVAELLETAKDMEKL